MAVRTKPRRPAPRGKARPRTRIKAAPKRPAQWKAHLPDALGLGVLFGSVVMCLSLAGSAGPVGRGIDWLLRAGFGSAAYLVPLATLLIALAAFVRREEAGRILVGTTLFVAAVAGIAHLIREAPLLTSGYRLLSRAGGVVGGLIAIPLKTYIGQWAGALACVFLGTLGILITTKTPLRRAAQAAWRALKAFGRGFIAFAIKLVESKPKPVAPESTAAEEAEEDAPRKRATLRLVEDFDEPPLIEVPPAVRPESAPAEGAPTIAISERTAPSPRGPRIIEQPTLNLELPETPYTLPPESMLRPGKAAKTTVRSTDEASRVLERTLQDFNVDARVTKVTRGPTVSLYEVELGAGVKVNAVTSLANDIGYAMGSPDVRIFAPIPGKSAIGIEVPNRDRDLVTLGDLVHSPEWRKQTHPLSCALGKDIAGHTICVNLAEMPHLLIAGTTGAGKSSCLNSLIASLLMSARPDQLKMILIDPKMVELTHFDNLPHLLSPVVTHPKQAAETLGWVVREMERRYEALRVVGQRNLELYNQAVEKGTLPDIKGERPEKMPYMAVIIDELADLMMVAARAVEDAICRIAQMARAVGIHLVVATQRPSVDVVTGLIKANIPSRVAFSVASQSDSRVILDVGGAEKLVGRGDMLFLPIGTSKPKRIQGAFVSEKELVDITNHVRAQQRVDYDEEVLATVASVSDDADDGDDSDPLLDEAMELVIRSQLGSTSMLQRKLKVGFSRAGRLMDLLERKGVVGPQMGSKARGVLMSLEDLENIRLSRSE